jgi:hypothetical protein
MPIASKLVKDAGHVAWFFDVPVIITLLCNIKLHLFHIVLSFDATGSTLPVLQQTGLSVYLSMRITIKVYQTPENRELRNLDQTNRKNQLLTKLSEIFRRPILVNNTYF